MLKYPPYKERRTQFKIHICIKHVCYLLSDGATGVSFTEHVLSHSLTVAKHLFLVKIAFHSCMYFYTVSHFFVNKRKRTISDYEVSIIVYSTRVD